MPRRIEVPGSNLDPRHGRKEVAHGLWPVVAVEGAAPHDPVGGPQGCPCQEGADDPWTDRGRGGARRGSGWRQFQVSFELLNDVLPALLRQQHLEPVEAAPLWRHEVERRSKGEVGGPGVRGVMGFLLTPDQGDCHAVLMGVRLDDPQLGWVTSHKFGGDPPGQGLPRGEGGHLDSLARRVKRLFEPGHVSCPRSLLGRTSASWRSRTRCGSWPRRSPTHRWPRSRCAR